MKKEVFNYINELIGSEWVLAGSAALKEYGYLTRSINDIDIIVFKDLYHDFSSNSELLKDLRQYNYRVFQTCNSGQFRGPDGRLISSFSVKIPFEIGSLDIFYHYNRKINFASFQSPGFNINIQDVKEIIAYKVEALRLNQLYTSKDYLKHSEDLRKMSADSKAVKSLLEGLGFV